MISNFIINRFNKINSSKIFLLNQINNRFINTFSPNIILKNKIKHNSFVNNNIFTFSTRPILFLTLVRIIGSVQTKRNHTTKCNNDIIYKKNVTYFLFISKLINYCQFFLFLLFDNIQFFNIYYRWITNKWEKIYY
jgi:hypothetical protein